MYSFFNDPNSSEAQTWKSVCANARREKAVTRSAQIKTCKKCSNTSCFVKQNMGNKNP